MEGATASLAMAAWTVREGSLRIGDGEAGERIRLAYVSPGYFEILGLRPVVGRGLGGARFGDEGAVPVVLSHGMWQDRMGGDVGVIGRIVTVNRAPHVVVGVAPPGFTGHRTGFSVHAWVPLDSHASLDEGAPDRYDRGAGWLGIVARLRNGAALPRATAEVASTMAGLESAHPTTNADRSPRVLPYHWQGADVVAGGDALLMGAIFAGLSGVALAIVCLNLAGMVFVRSASRERELALRLAIGSSRVRLVRYLMAEALVLAAVGGVLVTAVLWGALHGLSWRSDSPLPASLEVDAGTVALCMGLAMATTLVFGLLPAIRFSRPALLSALKDDSGGGGRRSGRFHRWAASFQTGLAVPVVVVAAGVIQGALSVGSAELGLEEEGLAVWVPMDLAADGYDAEAAGALARSLAAEVRLVPRVVAVAAADGVPLDYEPPTFVGVTPLDGGDAVTVRATRIGAGYLEALRTPILRGRPITEEDGPGSEPVAVMTASLAESLFAGENALGKRVRLTWSEDEAREYTLVGVSGDLAGHSLEAATDHVFLSLRQEPTTKVALAIRASSVDDDLLAAIRDRALALDPELARPAVVPFASLVEDASREFGIWGAFFSLIAALLLLLAALGIYGVVGFTVAGRTREIGVRMSLGSSRGQVLRMVLADALRLGLPGVVLGGLVGIVIATRVMNQMYVDIGLPLVDAPVLAAAAAAALTIVMAASLSPARRAAGVDPMEALRAE